MALHPSMPVQIRPATFRLCSVPRVCGLESPVCPETTTELEKKPPPHFYLVEDEEEW